MSTTDDFDILDWIESGTVAQRSVVIYNDPALAAEFEQLERELAVAERVAQDGERSMADGDPVAEILAKMQDLHDRWEASKSTWVVRGLADETIREIADARPAPTKPQEIPEDASEDVKAAHEAAVREYVEAAGKVQDERNFAYIAAALVRIETAKGAAHSISVDALRKMRARPHGAQRLTALINAVWDATSKDVEIPAPKSVRPSKGDQG